MFKTSMIVCAVVSGILTAVTAGLVLLFPSEWLETVAITCGTVFYHIGMRLAVGAAWIPLEHKINPDAAWYRERRFEAALYKRLHVKAWKSHVPTYAPSTFDIRQHTVEDILLATCHSERVHETIILLSFLPLAAVALFDAFWAFLLTSIAAALIDLTFVVVQRYNRPRLRTLLRRQQRQQQATH